MSDPMILKLDEHSLGLAPILVNDVFVAIKKINEEGTTAFLMEQNGYLALQTTNLGIVMEKKGVLTLQDDSETVLQVEEVQQYYLGG